MNKIIIITLTLFLLGCSTAEKEHSSKLTQDAEQKLMRSSSSLLIKNFMANLKSELMKGVKAGGFENAINVCQVKAPEITDKFLGEAYSIKRVTDKPRNQDNLADVHELEILSLFADSLKKLEYFDEWKDSENKKDYYFYKPIYIGKLCLKCHGDAKSIDKKAAIAVKEKYPDDKAIDYNAGDLRGMFVVNIKHSAGANLIKSAQNDSL